MKNLLILLLFVSTFLCLDSFAKPPKSSHIFVFHINGVNTTPDEALKNLKALAKVAQIQSNMITWDILYNESHGLLASDLWDVMRQKKQEAKELSIDDYVITYMKAYKLNYPIGSPAYNKLKDEIKIDYMNDPSFSGKNLPDIVDQFHGKVPREFASIIKLLKGYENTRNAYVLLLPHSQGVQYANQLWDYLVHGERFPTDRLAIFGIASPTDKMYGKVPPQVTDWHSHEVYPEYDIRYITADNDYVINSLSLFSLFAPQTNKPLAGNRHLSYCGDFLCHNLMESYLKDKNVSKDIALEIQLFVTRLKQNLVRQGVINSKNIRLLFSGYGCYSDGKGGRCLSLWLINNKGKVFCNLKGCNNTFGYLAFPQNEKWDPYFEQNIGFADKISPGNYRVLVESGMNMSFSQIRGNILYGIENHFDWSNYPPAYCRLYQNDHLPYVNDIPEYYSGIPTISLSGVMGPCAWEYPGVLHNGKFIVGEFALG